MKSADVIRAWKNEEYRLSLSEAERALLPAHPAGAVELTDVELGGAAGAAWPTALCPGSLVCSVFCPPPPPRNTHYWQTTCNAQVSCNILTCM
jgi:mersacidin/lichenicidin family type 2 lantibiotic